MFRKKKPRLSGGSEAEASLYARWIRESIPRAIRLHNAIGSGLSSPAPHGLTRSRKEAPGLTRSRRCHSASWLVWSLAVDDELLRAFNGPAPPSELPHESAGPQDRDALLTTRH